MEDGLLELAQGDVVEWKIGDITGRGRVCGMASTPISILGRNVILEIEYFNMETPDYPFTHFAMFEAYLTKV
jgi:hypothetical protein